jgi:hypothetical protein
MSNESLTGSADTKKRTLVHLCIGQQFHEKKSEIASNTS